MSRAELQLVVNEAGLKDEVMETQPGPLLCHQQYIPQTPESM